MSSQKQKEEFKGTEWTGTGDEATGNKGRQAALFLSSDVAYRRTFVGHAGVLGRSPALARSAKQQQPGALRQAASWSQPVLHRVCSRSHT